MRARPCVKSGPVVKVLRWLVCDRLIIGGILGFAIGWDSVWSWTIVGVSVCLLAWWHVEHVRGRTWEDELRRRTRR